MDYECRIEFYEEREQAEKLIAILLREGWQVAGFTSQGDEGYEALLTRSKDPGGASMHDEESAPEVPFLAPSPSLRRTRAGAGGPGVFGRRATGGVVDAAVGDVAHARLTDAPRGGLGGPFSGQAPAAINWIQPSRRSLPEDQG